MYNIYMYNIYIFIYIYYILYSYPFDIHILYPSHSAFITMMPPDLPPKMGGTRWVSGPTRT